MSPITVRRDRGRDRLQLGLVKAEDWWRIDVPRDWTPGWVRVNGGWGGGYMCYNTYRTFTSEEHNQQDEETFIEQNYNDLNGNSLGLSNLSGCRTCLVLQACR